MKNRKFITKCFFSNHYIIGIEEGSGYWIGYYYDLAEAEKELKDFKLGDGEYKDKEGLVDLIFD